MFGSIIQAILGLNRQPFSSGLDAAKKEAGNFKADAEKTFGGVGAALQGGLGKFLGGAIAGGGLLAWLKNGATFAGDLQDRADQLNASVERLQAIDDVMAGAGVDPAQTDKALGTLNEKMLDAIDGSDKTRAAFAALGIGMDEVLGKSGAPDEMLFRIADGLKGATDKTRAFSAALELLGKGGKKMRGALAEGSAPMAEAMQGFVVESEDAAAADRLGDKVEMWKKKILGVAPGKLVGMGARALEKLIDPDEWTNNLAGQKATLEQLRNRGIDPLEGLNEYQRALVEQGMSPMQAAQMRPGSVEAKPSQEKAKEAQEVHDARHQDAEKEAAFTREAAAIRKKSDEAAMTTKERIRALNSEILSLTERQQGADATRTAELDKQKAALQAQRKELLTQQNLMSPDERRAQGRAERDKKQAAEKADRQIEREALEELGKQKGGAARDARRAELNEARRLKKNGVDLGLKKELEKDAGKPALTDEKVQALMTVLDELKTAITNWN